jgi:hypothetical protein
VRLAQGNGARRGGCGALLGLFRKTWSTLLIFLISDRDTIVGDQSAGIVQQGHTLDWISREGMILKQKSARPGDSSFASQGKLESV